MYFSFVRHILPRLGRPEPRRRPGDRFFRPKLESLEDRLVPQAGGWSGLADNALAPAYVSTSITISPDPLPLSIVGGKFSQQLIATGGSGKAYNFTASGLPSWLNLSYYGLLSGTPTTAVSSPVNFTVSVTDSLGNTGSSTYWLTVEPAITISANLAATATQGDSVSFNLFASGGSGADYTFALARGSVLPRGLNLNGNVISGIPTVSGTYSFTVVATDGNGATGSQPLTLTINPAIVIQPLHPPIATVGDFYSQALSATGGSGSGYIFSLPGGGPPPSFVGNGGASPALASSGGLPPGLFLVNGVITGTPSHAGTYTFTIIATDSNRATVAQVFTMTVDPALVLTPGSLPGAAVGVSFSQQLSVTGGSGKGYKYSVSGLPSWLTLTYYGLLIGTPPSYASATIHLLITVTDSVGGSVSVPYTLAVAGGVTVGAS
jgi:hypothetical protein